MSTTILPEGQSVFTSKELSAILHKSCGYFATKRFDGGGPKFQKLGPEKHSSVVYARQDVLQWLRENQHSETGEYA
jgi:hypothetical protein